MEQEKKGKELFLFLIISFLIPLVSVVIQINIFNHFISFILYGIQAAAPTISATIVLTLSKGKHGFAQIFCKKHLRLAVILPVMIACTTMLFAKLLFCAWYRITFSTGNISAMQLITISWTFISEEIGWRGYLAPALKILGTPKWIIPCVVGIIWGLWHYHYFWQGRIDVPIALFFIGCLAESYIYSFLMKFTSDNIVSAMSYHFAWNLFLHVFAINPSENNGNIYPYTVLVGMEVLVLFVVWTIGKAKTAYNRKKKAGKKNLNFLL